MTKRRSIEDLVADYWAIPESDRDGNIDALRQIIRHHDAADDVDQGYRWRMRLMDHATIANRSDVLLVSYAWCLAKYDADPQRFDVSQLLWRYKWVLANVPNLVSVPRAEIDRLMEDFRTRLLAAGFGIRTYWLAKASVLLQCGEIDEAAEISQRHADLPRDAMSDCRACEIDDGIDLLVQMNRHEEAMKKAEPLLTDKISCSTVPESTWAKLLPSFVATDNVDLIRSSQSTWLSRWRNSLDDHWIAMAKFSRHEALHGDPVQACGFLDELAYAATKTRHHWDRWHFACNAAAVFAAAASKTDHVDFIAATRMGLTEPSENANDSVGGNAVVGETKSDESIHQDKLDDRDKADHHDDADQPRRQYSTRWLATELRRSAMKLAAEIDHRNGNHWYTSRTENITSGG